MKFTDFEVVRVGETVVLSCFSDEPKPGVKLQITMGCTTQPEAEQHEKMLQHLVMCAQLYEYMPADVVEATLQLTKGKIA